MGKKVGEKATYSLPNGQQVDDRDKLRAIVLEMATDLIG